MPYQSNSPRFEFSTGDRTSLQNLAIQALSFMNNASPSTKAFPILRSDFDAWYTAANAINPTMNYIGPWPDTR